MSALDEVAAALRSGATPSGVELLKRNSARVVARAGDVLVKVFLERPENAAREARALDRARARGVRVPERVASGPGWTATRFLARARPATRDDLPMLLAAIEDAQARGLVHGDLHVGNLLVDGGEVVFLDLQRARFLPHVPGFLRRRELGWLAYSLGEPLPAELAHVRYWRDRRARVHEASRTRRCLKESGSFTAFARGPDSGFRRRDADPAALAAALEATATATPFKDGPGGRLFRVAGLVAKEHPSRAAARRAWLGGNGLEARGIASARPLAWAGRWLLMEDGGATLSDWVARDFAAADERERRALAARLGGLVAALHRRGIYHADLKANNVAYSRERGPRLLDYGRVRFGARVGRRRRVKNLAQLNAALPDAVPAALREAALAAYLAESGYAEDAARLRRDVVSESLRRSHLWSGC